LSVLGWSRRFSISDSERALVRQVKSEADRQTTQTRDCDLQLSFTFTVTVTVTVTVVPLTVGNPQRFPVACAGDGRSNKQLMVCETRGSVRHGTNESGIGCAQWRLAVRVRRASPYILRTEKWETWL
jgi:hypothetical protein